MPNSNLELSNQQTLKPGQEPQAARQLGSEQAQARNGNVPENEPQGNTLGQQKGAARIAQDAKAETKSTDEGAPSGVSVATAGLLKKAEAAIPTPAFLLGLIWINIHIFGHSVLGEKVFCELGEEWVPPNLRTGVYAESFKSKVKTIGLLEKIGLVILDVAALVALLVAAYLILEIIRKLYPLLKIYLWFAQFT